MHISSPGNSLIAMALLEHRRVAEHYIVAQQYAEGLVADEALRAPNRVTQTLCLLLAQEVHIRHVRDLAHCTGFLLLAIGQQTRLKIGGIVKIVLDRGLAAVCDDEDLLNARCDRFLYDVLEDGLVHQRQHLLGDALGVRQQSRSETGCGDYSFPYFHVLTSSV